MLVETTSMSCHVISPLACVSKVYLICSGILPPAGLHVRSTQQWTQFYPCASSAERKLRWRDYKSTISNRRRQNQENYRNRACTVKSCCTAAPLSSALRNFVLNDSSKGWHRNHRRSEGMRIKLVPVMQTDASIKTKVLTVDCFLWIFTLTIPSFKYHVITDIVCCLSMEFSYSERWEV